MPDMNEKLRAKIAEWRAAAKKWGDNYLISGSKSSRTISRCLTERADEIESLLDAPEPPGSVAGDEYDAAARRCVEFLLIPICGVNPNSKEELVRLIGGEFRAACVKREAELKELQEAWDKVGEQQVRVCLPPNHYSVEMGMDAFRRLQLAIDTLLAAGAKQGKETR